MPEKIGLEEINDYSEREFVARFGSLYEHSPWVAEAAYARRPFDGLQDLHRAFVRSVHDASEERKLALIRAHPDLAGKAAMAGELTQESTSEQSSAGLDRLSAEEYEEFTRMNQEYRKKFGIPMVVAVREHTKATILANAGERLAHTRDQELETSLGEISKIAYLRLRDLIEPSSNGTETRTRASEPDEAGRTAT